MTDATNPGGRTIAGRYRLDRPIASGGMAEVWEATDTVLDRPVAVKLLHPHLAADPKLRARFHHEAVAAARLVHHAIVAIYDTCDEPGAEAIVMELVRGRTLREFLDERTRLDPVEVVHIGAEVADALACAHRAGIVHRDVKPANILLSDDGRVLVTDFGIAKVRDAPDMTRTSELLGTVKYLAPEQVENGPVDARTDVYALGAVLYEALCGQPPFTGDTQAGIALARLHRTPAPPHDVVAGVPASLESVVMRSLARHPDARYATADDLRTALLATRLDHLDDPTVMITALGGPPPTPPPGTGTTPSWGTPAVAPPPPRRRVGTGVVISAVVVIALVLVGLLLARTDIGRDLFEQDPTSTSNAPLPPVTVTRARSFDPQGGGDENEHLAANAIDGRGETTWRTETYASRAFGNLKQGVGLVIELQAPAPLGDLAISTPTTGWAVAVFVGDGSATSLEGWGEPVTTASGVQDGTTLDLGGAEGDAVLVWITDLGDGPTNRVEIAELALTA